MNLLYTHYDIPIIGKEEARDPYWFQTQSAASVFYRLLWKNWMVFGEAGLTVPSVTRAKKGKGLITGCMISLSRYIDLSGALYYYGTGLYTPYGHAFKRYSTDHANEKGGYVCLQFTPLPSWQIATSGHFFATLSPKPQLPIASSGHRFTTRSHYIWNRATLFMLQHKLQKNPRNKPKEADRAVKIEQAIQHSLKCKIDHKLTHYWWTHLELQYTRSAFLGQVHHGYALANTQKWKGSKWKLSCKTIYFNTQNYATRLYFYLPNPLYSGTQFHPYYGHGLAMTWLIGWRPIGLVRLEIKYTFTYAPKALDKAASTNRCPPSKGRHDGTLQLLVSF